MDSAIRCPHCGQPLKIPPGYAGQAMICPTCRKNIPGRSVKSMPSRSSGNSPILQSQPAPLPPPATPSMPVMKVAAPAPSWDIQCPHCRNEMGVNAGMVGSIVACPHCQGQMEVPGPATPAPQTNNRVIPQNNAPPISSPPAPQWSNLQENQGYYSPSSPVAAEQFFGTLPHFEGSLTPQISLLPEETVLDCYEASILDLGWLRWILTHRAKLVLTSHRVFFFDKRLLTNYLQIYWLPQIAAVHVNKVINWWVLLWILPSAFFTEAILLSISVFIWQNITLPMIFTFVNFLAWFVVTFLFAFTQSLAISVDGGTWIGMRTAGFRSQEGKRFVDKLFTQLGKRESNSE